MPTQADKGATFGEWTVVGQDPSKASRWLVTCSCGTAKSVDKWSITAGHSRSCGCLTRAATTARNIKHGKSGTALYKVWVSMRDRCLNPESKSYQNYGGRGISVHSSWGDFATFAEDVGPAPGNGYSLDRIDNSRGYEPGNVRWATRLEQSRNTRRTVNITYQGKTQCLKDWSVELGVAYSMLIYRISTLGMTVEEAFTKPSRYQRRSAAAQIEAIVNRVEVAA